MRDEIKAILAKDNRHQSESELDAYTADIINLLHQKACKGALVDDVMEAHIELATVPTLAKKHGFKCKDVRNGEFQLTKGV